MAVPHYNDEYDDTYPSSIQEEFGDEIAIALTRSSNFTSATKSALLNKVKDVINQRKKLQNVVSLEKTSIISANDSLSDIAEDAQNILNKELKIWVLER